MNVPVPVLSRPPQPSLPNWANQLVNKPYLVEEVNEQLKAKVIEDDTPMHEAWLPRKSTSLRRVLRGATSYCKPVQTRFTILSVQPS